MKKLKIKLFGKPNKGITFLSFGNVKKDLEKLNSIKKERGIRFLVLCDLHFLEEEQLDKILSLNYDCCLMLGDIPSEILPRIKALITKPIYAVGGNHDTREMYTNAGFEYINGKVVEIEGIKIAGIEGSNRYKDTDELVMLTQKESVKLAKSLPRADLLISHDSFYHKYGKSPNKRGLKGIDLYIKRNKPIFHFHGHYHIYDNYQNGKTQCFACYRCMLIDTYGKTEKIF